MISRSPTRLFLAAMLVFFVGLTVQPAAAQDTEGYPRVGVGVSVSGALLADSFVGNQSGFRPVASVLVPIDVSETFRIEPILGYTRLSQEQSFNRAEETQTTSVLRLGLGVFGGVTRDETHLYYGLRAGYNRLNSSVGDNDDSEPLDGFFIGPTTGGEYLFSDFFSLGAEVEARYTRFGESEGSLSLTSTSLGLRPALVARFYF